MIRGLRRMEDRGSKSQRLVALCVIPMLLISAMAQGPDPAPDASPVAPITAPSESPPAPPPAEAPIPQQRFVTNTSFILTVSNGSSTDRQTKTALASPNGEYQLSLVMDGFGIESNRKYCWTEVHNALGNLTFRENCSPPKVQQCTLSLTEKGDLRLTLESNGGKLVSWRTETEDDGVVEVKLDDTGVVTLVKADETVVWTSADDKHRCLDLFHPKDGAAGSVAFSKLLIVCATILSLAISSCMW